MRTDDISFTQPLLHPQIGDEAAVWVPCAQSIAPKGYLLRQGHITGVLFGKRGKVVAYAVTDSVSQETVYVAKDMLFIPEGNN